jgi:hypothetical protein
VLLWDLYEILRRREKKSRDRKKERTEEIKKDGWEATFFPAARN